MAKGGTCELCGLPDNSYSIEEDGNVFKVCKLCYDGSIAKHGSDSNSNWQTEDIDELAERLGVSPDESERKVATLSDEEMAKLLKPDKKRGGSKTNERRNMINEERRKIDAAVKRAVAAKVEQTLAADTEEITRELLDIKAEIEEEKRRDEELLARAAAEKAEKEKEQKEVQAMAEQENKEKEKKETDPVYETPDIFKLISETDKSKADNDSTQPRAGKDVELDREIREWYAEQMRLAAISKAANPKSDDERIKITSPEVELRKDTRLKTNLDVATKGHVGSIRFLNAFKYVMHPVTYAIFAGLAAVAVFTALMITMTWFEAIIDISACVGAVTIGALLVWYLKRRLETDKRTVLLRIRQEQILFDSMVSPCYRELKTKYPMIKALAWLLSRLSVILPTVTIIGGTAAGIITTFLVVWWAVAPVVAGSVVAAVLLYYLLKISADAVNYKLDIERNQQIAEQTMLDLLASGKKKTK